MNALGKATLSCSANQVAKWNGSAWICAADEDKDTTYTAGTGLNLTGTTFNVEVPLSLSASIISGVISGTNSNGPAVRGEHTSGNYGYLGTVDGGVYGYSVSGTGGYFSSSSGYGLIVENGNVGIGTTSPAEKLTVNGNAQFGNRISFGSAEYIEDGGASLISTGSNRIQTNGYEYTNPKTYYLNIPAIAFVKDDAQSDTWNFDITGYANISSGTASYQIHAYAPVHLPEDATITEFACYSYDNSFSFDFQMEVRLNRRSITSTSAYTLAMLLVNSNGYSTAVYTNSDNTIDYPVVSNSNYQYYIYLSWYTDYSGSSMRFYGCRIKYSITALQP